MNNLKNLYTFDGRINRSAFLAFQFIIGLAVFVTSYVASLLPEIISIIMGVIVMSAWFWFTLSLASRRAHDFGRSGWFGLLIFIPLMNLVLLVAPGDSEKNKYGDAPKSSSKPTNIIFIVVLSFTIGLFMIGLMFIVPTSDSAWAYTSYCNNTMHKEAHKVFEGEKLALRECSEHSSLHFDEYRGHKNEKGERHSSGCKMISAPFPWSLSVEW